VDWYPWGDEAFAKARAENKPLFLSVGYSTCHWCHVMAHECFEDAEVAAALNRDFVAVKVDKEERPDIDSIYMQACTSLTGSGGWPLTVLMDAEGRPFFAGTYFPKRSRYGMPGLLDLLAAIRREWRNNQKSLLSAAERITARLQAREQKSAEETDEMQLIHRGISQLQAIFDPQFGGFGRAPKFPAPHNLLFLLEAHQCLRDADCLAMAEKTLQSMAKGGIFDHIGFGFSRYSTDRKWLTPHFEKMLYDNALLVMAYTKAFAITQNPVYKTIVEKTLTYIKREMTHPQGGFYAAQDADSDGVEGKYYVFMPMEIRAALGEADGAAFCQMYDITETGNFEGKNIPNQIGNPAFDGGVPMQLNKLYEYRKTRTKLHKDDKILTAWNALMIAALADASVVFNNPSYLAAAEKAAQFIEAALCEGDRIFTAFRDGKRSTAGFLDDYAFCIHALLRLHSATAEAGYLARAQTLTKRAIADFWDAQNGGFYLTAGSAEALITRPKENYDGAIPSGNAAMAMNLIALHLLTGEHGDILREHITYTTSTATDAPSGHSYLLYGLLKRQYSKRSPSDYVCDEKGCRNAQ